MDRQILRLAWVFLALFVLLMVQTNYLQVIAADRLANDPHNQRLLLQEFEIDRGDILARDARTVLARSRATEGRFKYLRQYPTGPRYAHLTGFYSLIFGRTELERSQNDFLSGRAAELIPQTLVDEILGRDKRGGTVITTIDPALQKAAQQALGNLQGAVAAVDPQTGEVLALYANPTYDPNPLASHTPEKVRAAFERISQDPQKPTVSRAHQELFPPGSTFKLVTTAAALENGIGPDEQFPNPRALDLPQTDLELQNFGGDHCLGGAQRITLAQALQISCNVTFAEIGLDLGAEALVQQAERFGFNGDVPFPSSFAEGLLPPDSVGPDRLPAVAFSAIGQQDVRANPLHMALVASAIANGGVQMEPQLVRQVRDASGRVVRTVEPTEYGRPLSAENARLLTEMMVGVVAGGTGAAAQIPGVEVAGKTGTAQTERGDPHAWFVSFAPAADAQIAVAVVVLNGGSLGSEATGGQVAAPIARAVIEAALRG